MMNLIIKAPAPENLLEVDAVSLVVARILGVQPSEVTAIVGPYELPSAPDADSVDRYTMQTPEAAKILGVTVARVNQLVKNNRLSAIKSGRDYLLDPHEVAARKASPSRGGRPKGLISKTIDLN